MFLPKNLCRKSLPVLSTKKFRKSLTDFRNSIENRDTYLIFPNMGKLEKSAVAGALMLGGAMVGEPALAEEKSGQVHLAAATTETTTDVRDCMELRKELGWSRKEYRTCKREQRQARIAEQERIIAALEKILAEQDMRIDELGHIRDANGRELARIQSINGKLLLRRQRADERIETAEENTARILDEIERYVLDNS